MNNKFSWQSFLSIGLLLSFIIMLVSGIVLYVAPEGSLSRWIDWSVFNLNKKQWEHQHTIFSYLFILFSVFHIFKINWGLLLSYFVPEKINLSNLKEILIAFVITILVFLGTLYDINPFRFVINTGNNISDNHSLNVEMPNIPDAERLSLRDFSEKVLEVSYEEVYNKLIDIEFESVDENIIVSEFCEINKITPQELYKILKKELCDTSAVGSYSIPDISSFSSFTNNQKMIL